MPGPEFFQTRMGQQFYDGTMPKLAKDIDGLGDAVCQLAEQISELVAVVRQLTIVLAEGEK